MTGERILHALKFPMTGKRLFLFLNGSEDSIIVPWNSSVYIKGRNKVTISE